MQHPQKSLKELLAVTINQNLPDLKPYLNEPDRGLRDEVKKVTFGKFQLVDEAQIAYYYGVRIKEVRALRLPWVYVDRQNKRKVYFIFAALEMVRVHNWQMGLDDAFPKTFSRSTKHIKDLHLANGANPEVFRMNEVLYD